MRQAWYAFTILLPARAYLPYVSEFAVRMSPRVHALKPVNCKLKTTFCLLHKSPNLLFLACSSLVCWLGFLKHNQWVCSAYSRVRVLLVPRRCLAPVNCKLKTTFCLLCVSWHLLFSLWFSLVCWWSFLKHTPNPLLHTAWVIVH
jgi:hypothetical protein